MIERGGGNSFVKWGAPFANEGNPGEKTQLRDFWCGKGVVLRAGGFCPNGGRGKRKDFKGRKRKIRSCTPLGKRKKNLKGGGGGTHLQRERRKKKLGGLKNSGS